MIGIFGGSFDPPHLGHKKIITEFWKNFPKAKRLFIVPNKISPFKEKKTASEVEILRMLEIFILDFNTTKTEICDFEINRKKISYSINTIRHFHKKYPKDKIYFLIGEDNLQNFYKWKNPEEILKLATLVVFRRKKVNSFRNFKSQKDLSEIKYLKIQKSYSNKIILLNNKKINSSSSEIRDLLENENELSNFNLKKLNYFLGLKLSNYIIREQIYRLQKK